ncbi:hypothetical protein ACFLSX_01590 [Calditrichota bacterium]
MYSPKIAEDLIPMVYRLSLNAQKPMTKIVDEYLRPQIIKKHYLLLKTKERKDKNGRKK